MNVSPSPYNIQSIRAPQSDIHAFGRTLWRWKLLVILVAIPLPYLAITRGTPPSKFYTSEAIVTVDPNSVDPLTGTYVQTYGFSDATRAATVLRSPSIAKIAAGRISKPPKKLLDLSARVRGSVNQNTGELKISAVGPTEAAAVETAQAFTSALQTQRKNEAASDLKAAVSQVRSQLATATGTNKEAIRSQLSRLQFAQRNLSSRVSVISPAVDASLRTRNTNRSVPLSIAMGLLLGIGAALLAEQLDRRVRTADELERIAGSRLLAVVPTLAFTGRDDRNGYVTQAIELLRAAVFSFHRDQGIKTILMMSGRQGDGKTTLSVSLAQALAHAGMRVVLMDADLRHPQVAVRMKLENKVGTSDVLKPGGAKLTDALIRIPGMVEDNGGRLLVLPSGPVSAYPGVLFVSDEMSKLKAQLEALADIVLIDTPAALATSDAIPLIAGADGVLVVTRLRRTRHVTLKRLFQRITEANGTVLGVIATGDRGASGHERYSYKAYERRNLRDRIKDRLGF